MKIGANRQADNRPRPVRDRLANDDSFLSLFTMGRREDCFVHPWRGIFRAVAPQYTEEFQILLQALVAMILGGLLGWEREAAGKWAGFRTHVLVCVATFLFVRLGQLLIADSAARFPGNYLRTDPTRLIEAIAVGISFIGAGTIFRDADETRKKGLTTAASLLATAPIGLAIALQRYVVACGVTLIALFILHTLHRLEARLIHPSNRNADREIP